MSNKEEAKKAALAYSKILRHIGEQLEAVNADSLSDENRDTMPYTILELADAFAEKAGFMFSKEQALPLAYTFELINQACQNMARMAKKFDQTETVTTFNWAAAQSLSMVHELEQRHKDNEGGVIGFDADMKTKLTQAIGGTAEWERQDYDPEEKMNNQKGDKPHA
ncbi:MAG: hypothetical protein ACK5LE_04195 [Alphaproteobacteria bacterium]